MYSEKATKFCEILTLLLTDTTLNKSKVKISQNFVAFSEYMNFNIKIFSYLSSLLSVVELHSQAFVCNVNCTSDLQNCPESSYYKICNVHSAFLICDSAHNPSLGKIDHNTGIGIDRPLSENLH